MKTQEEILSLLAEGLKAAGERHTALNLGDRGRYLGVSDLALGLTCPRAVVAAKLSWKQAAPAWKHCLNSVTGTGWNTELRRRLGLPGGNTSRNCASAYVTEKYRSKPIWTWCCLMKMAAA